MVAGNPCRRQVHLQPCSLPQRVREGIRAIPAEGSLCPDLRQASGTIRIRDRIHRQRGKSVVLRAGLRRAGHRRHLLYRRDKGLGGYQRRQHKDRAAQLWCENTTRLAEKPWAYLKVLRRPTNSFSRKDSTICLCLSKESSCSIDRVCPRHQGDIPCTDQRNYLLCYNSLHWIQHMLCTPIKRPHELDADQSVSSYRCADHHLQSWPIESRIQRRRDGVGDAFFGVVAIASLIGLVSGEFVRDKPRSH